VNNKPELSPAFLVVLMLIWNMLFYFATLAGLISIKGHESHEKAFFWKHPVFKQG